MILVNKRRTFVSFLFFSGTKKDNYSLSQINKVLDALHKSQWFTMLDLASGVLANKGQSMKQFLTTITFMDGTSDSRKTHIRKNLLKNLKFY